MTSRVLITDNSIRVSKPGVDVTSAILRDLVLSIDQRVGQILGAGQAGFVNIGTNPNFPGPFQAVINYGPFDRAPDLFLYPVMGDGFAYAHAGFIRTSSASNQTTFFNMCKINSCTITERQCVVIAAPEFNYFGDGPQWYPAALVYVIYRKPLTA
jgi:hypothetical protein